MALTKGRRGKCTSLGYDGTPSTLENMTPHTPLDNPFSILGLPQRFALEDSTIERAYLSQVSRLHPDSGDRGAGGSEWEDYQGQDEKEAQTARLNEAKSILKNVEKRANVLLQLLGGPPANADKTLPAGFLMEMMELRQAIEEELSFKGALDKWQKWGEQERKNYETALGELFISLEERKEDPKAIAAKIREQLNALRYIERLIEQLDPRYKPSGS